MAYTARELITQADGIADLQNAEFISYDEKIQALNESYRDLYNQYTENQGDYWVLSTDYQMDDTNVVPDTNNWWYYLPLPDDFYKLHTVSWNSGGNWFNVDSFPESLRNNPNSYPRYRIKNDKLWIICNGRYQIRMEYYPPPQVITAPADPISYFPNATDYSLNSVIYPSFVDKNDTILYTKSGGFVIYAQSPSDNYEEHTIYTDVGAVLYPQYSKGYVYWAVGVNIYRAPTDLVTSLAAPTTLITNGSPITNFTVIDDFIYYNDGSNLRRSTVTGSGITIVSAGAYSNVTKLNNTITYISGSSVLYGGVAVTGIPGTLVSISSDNVNLYAISTINGINTLIKCIFDSLTTSITSYATLTTGVNYIGSQIVTGATIVTKTDSTATINQITGVSTYDNTVLDYPTTEVNEIIAYSSALFYVRKATDDKKMAVIKSRLDELWNRFVNSVMDRDEYQTYPINSHYNQRGTWPYFGGFSG